MGLLDDARRAADTPATEGDDDPPTRGGGATVDYDATDTRNIEVMANGEPVTVDPADTIQSSEEEGTWLTGRSKYGIPRGNDAVQGRQIVQTAPMQSITNAVTDQLTGGDLTFEGRDDVLDDLSDAEQDAVQDLQAMLRDVLEGPHLPNLSLDDLITAAVEDMMGVGQAIWQPLGAADADVPVVALQLLDPLTVRMNVDEHNRFRDPPYYQAPGAFGSGGVSSLADTHAVPLQHDDIIVMDYPNGTRSYRSYPISPAFQVREWLEILSNSVTHHNRFYDDNEIPAGLLQVTNASQSTVDDIKDEIQQASADPRKAPVVGTDGGAAQWLELGGTAINLDVIQEQQWFFSMCLGAVGLGKAEVGLIEDVNRANGEVESSRVAKRVLSPFTEKFASAFMEVADQFDAYGSLGRPFKPTISHSDMRAERAKEERLRKQLQAGAITPRQYARRTGDTELAEDADEWTIELAGETINYGNHPKWVTTRLMSAAAGDGVDADGQPDAAPAPDGNDE